MNDPLLIHLNPFEAHERKKLDYAHLVISPVDTEGERWYVFICRWGDPGQGPFTCAEIDRMMQENLR